MKKRHFGFLFMALSVFVSCSDNIQKSYWDDGTLKSELRYKDGKLDGECVWYYSITGFPRINDVLSITA